MAAQAGSAVAGLNPSPRHSAATAESRAPSGRQTREGSASHAVVAALRQELLTAGPRYDFFQLVRLLQRWVGQEANTGLPRVVFRPVASLAFQPAEVSVAWQTRDQGRDLVILETPWLGLYGPSTPLPLYYTEDLLDDQAETQVLRAFLDLFNHRAHELLGRIWQKYRCHLRMRANGEDPVTEQLAALARLSLRDGYRFRYVDRRRLLPLIGVLSLGIASAHLIERVLRDYFQLPGLKVRENILTETEIPEDQCNRLGQDNATLGEDLALGSRILDCSSRFEILVEAVDLATALAFRPERTAYRAMMELVDFLAPSALDVTLRFRVAGESIPNCYLGEGEPMLGLNTQLGHAQAEDLELVY